MTPRRLTLTAGLVCAIALLGCASADRQMMGPTSGAAEPMDMEMEEDEADDAFGGRPMPRPRPAAAPMEGKKARMADRSVAKKEARQEAPPAPPGAKADKDGRDAGEAEGEQVATRAWFPESMLWEPLVETGDDGVAVVPVMVPDQLTTWRVLALAHDRAGHQAGAEHRFDGTLPVYVEPVMPGWLYAGDQLQLPVQAMNTTQGRVDGRIEVRASGAMSGLGTAPVSLASGGSAVRTLPLSVEGAGAATVEATLYAGSDSDAAKRVVTVNPTGRPVVADAGGTLASQRTLTLPAPKGADPRTERLEVLVFPGPLAVVQAELERVAGGASSPAGGYGFAVATHARTLSKTVGVEVDGGVLRSLQIVSWQRLVRSARAPSPGQAADMLLALEGVEGHELAEGLRARLVRTVVQGQRADGTYSRDARSTAQRVVVETALAGMSLPQTEQGARLRAAGAIERLLPQIDDAYTASVVLSSGLMGSSVESQLRAIVEDGLVEVDGRYTLPVPRDVRNAWGLRPSMAEMRAMGALALSGHDARGDLVASLMQGWSARTGFGAGSADPLALRAIAEALPGTTEDVTVRLTVDGREVGSTTLDPTQPKVPGTLVASPRGGAGELTLTAEPEVPGLAFVATRRSWVPWSGSDRVPGVDAEVSAAGLSVGQKGSVRLTLAAPKGAKLVVEQGLPAGAAVDEVSLGAQVGGQLTGAEVTSDRVTLTTRAFHAGEIMELVVPVTPAFAGRFTTVPLTVSVDGAAAVPMAPLTWVVRGGES